MEQGMEKTEAECQAIAEVLWLWAALFDGPPAAPVWTEFRQAVWPSIQRALGEDGVAGLPAATVDDLGREYEQWLLIPDAGGQASAYDDEAGEAADGGPDLWLLAAALDMTWRKEEFVAGRAFPVRPDHVSVLLALWGALLPLPADAEIAGRPAGEWVETVGCAAERVLRRLAAGLPSGGPYQVLAAAAAAFARHLLAWRAGDGLVAQTG